MRTASSDGGAATLLLALPPLALAAAAVLLTVLGLFGLNPLWPHAPDLTMAEAAAVRDRATIVAMARNGVDPAPRMRVRAGMVRNRDDLFASPAEAAVIADRAEILHVLVANGLTLTADDAHRLICLGRRVGSDEAMAWLTERFPAGGPCEGEATAAAGRDAETMRSQ